MSMERTKPLVSVVIPVYNVEQYLQQCLDSVIDQTYSVLEIILVDDGSTDASGDICEEYEKKDKRIKVIHKPNGGLSDARNAGLDQMTGDYLLFVDSDDYIHKEMIQRMLENAACSDADMVIAGYKEFYEGDDLQNIVLTGDFQDMTTRDALLRLYSGSQNTTIACAKLYKKNLYQDYRFPVGKLHEDEFLTYKVICEAKKIIYLSDELYYYRRRRDSISLHERNNLETDTFEALLERQMFFEKRNMNEMQSINIDHMISVIVERAYEVYVSGQNNADEVDEFYDKCICYLKQIRKYKRFMRLGAKVKMYLFLRSKSVLFTIIFGKRKLRQRRVTN